MEGPEFPEQLRYLWEWYKQQLYAQSGVNEHGFCPLTHTTIRHWAENMDEHPKPHEIEALLLIDKAYLFPGDPPKEEG